ncbi:molecular chaperone DnaJ [uncultured Halopseudomonas sp.]|uniref:molecular chaperone DnaJ n=1 Tax=uncultured Halopseudomonas sp. TaxID=2901193 RepID=UPI0030ED3A9C|tara:strand:+ start:15843 stop:16592 length:750 start_codon:yes stop_codon:yes gene_type:complete
MSAFLLLGLLVGVGGWLWIRSTPAGQRKPVILKLVIIGTVAVVALLALTGRFYLVLALLAGLFPLLRRMLPGLLLGRFFRGFGLPGMGSGRSKASTGNQSRVSSQILEMTLDHDSGDMSGRVLEGPFADQQLADLSEAQFIELLGYCRQNDNDSARLLESYLDRRFGDSWRADDSSGETGGDSREQGSKAGAGSLTEAEALEVLGLEAGATQEEIIQAHRLMMQKMHPDRGGSTYLASLINEAKDVLLG